jgi:hypothetical protein
MEHGPVRNTPSRANTLDSDRCGRLSHVITIAHTPNWLQWGTVSVPHCSENGVPACGAYPVHGLAEDDAASLIAERALRGSRKAWIGSVGGQDVPRGGADRADTVRS